MLARLKVVVQITYLQKKKKTNETKIKPPKLKQTIKKWYIGKLSKKYIYTNASDC
jgi:hypothetical protein